MEVFFVLASLIVALLISSLTKTDKNKSIKTLPQLKEDFNFQAIKSKDPKVLGDQLQGHYNGFNVHVHFQDNSHNNSNSKLNSIIKIDLNVLSPYFYQISPLHSPNADTFYDHFNISSTDASFNEKQALKKSADILIKNHALIKASNWTVERSILKYEGVNFLEDEEDLKNFKQLLKVITIVAKDLQEHIKATTAKNYPSFKQLGEKLKYKAILRKDHPIFSAFQHSNLNMPYVLYYQHLKAGELVFLSLQLESGKTTAKFELRLKKDPKFQMKIFSDNTNLISSFFKGQDIEIKDEVFDDAFIIQSDDQLKTKQLLVNQSFREHLLALKHHALTWSLNRDQLLFQVDWDPLDQDLLANLQKVIESSIKIYTTL
jgi:hypothetical protein